MLLYLDNFISNKEDANENYARELLELHTLELIILVVKMLKL